MKYRAEYFPLVAAIQEVTGKRVSLPTAMRWITSGVRGTRLQSWLIGGRRLTTIPAVEQFIAEQNREHFNNEPAAKPLSEAKQALALSRANREADDIFGE
jgi:hypothetical protein